MRATSNDSIQQVVYIALPNLMDSALAPLGEDVTF